MCDEGLGAGSNEVHKVPKYFGEWTPFRECSLVGDAMDGSWVWSNCEVVGSNDRIKGLDEATPLWKAGSTEANRTTTVKEMKCFWCYFSVSATFWKAWGLKVEGYIVHTGHLCIN